MDKAFELNLFEKNQNVNSEKINTEWPSIEEYGKRKTETIKKYGPIFDTLIRDNIHEFFSPNDDEIKELSELMAIFVFGIKMVYQKFGEKYKNIDIKFDTDLENAFAIRPRRGLNEDPVYLINPIYISKWRNLKKDSIIWGINAGGIKNPKLKDLFELGGVEESAHSLFINEKDHTGNPGFDSGQSLMHELLSSDIEYRALFWRLSYVRKYKPEYVADYKNLLDNIGKIRKAARNSPKK